MESLHTILDFIRWGASRFAAAGLYFGHGTDNALDEAAALVLHALHLPPDCPQLWLEGRLTHEEKSTVINLLQRRVEERIPAPYLMQQAWFAGLAFYVTPDVLIPRSPIAELIEHGFEPWTESQQIHRLLDLCCGSGCIGIAAAHFLPEIEVDLADISEPALRIAQRNLTEHGLDDRVRAIRSDLFSALSGEVYDVIVSNPPYVGPEEMASLPAEYRHEPVLALRADEHGIAVIRKILQSAQRFLSPSGIIVVEVGMSAPALEEAYPEVPFTWIEFQRGGEGVFIFTRDDLDRYAPYFIK